MRNVGGRVKMRAKGSAKGSHAPVVAAAGAEEEEEEEDDEEEDAVDE